MSATELDHHPNPSPLPAQRLVGKTALVTGATSGIGLATAQLFAAHGARLAITGLDPGRLEVAAATLGPDVLALRTDARSAAETQSAMDRVRERFNGHLDVLFVNAGAAFPAPLEDVTEAHLDDLVAINFKGAFFTVQKAAPLLGRGSSVILNTSWLNSVGTPGLSVLSATKAAVRSLARTLGAELAPRGVRVNALSPGAITTPIYSKMGLAPDALQTMAAGIQARVPVGRFGTPEEVAAAALFLASDDSAYLLGAEIVVDGGLSQL